MATELTGAVELRLALRKFAPDLSKETQKQMAKILKTVTTVAKGFLPSDGKVLSGWSKPVSSENLEYRPFPRYSLFEAKRGIGYKTSPSRPNKNGFVALARIVNSSAAGAIYETAGRKNPDGQPVFQRSKFTPVNYREDRRGYNKSLNPNAGRQFLDNLNSSGELVNARPTGMVGRPSRKQTGRVIFRAWAQDNGRANAALIAAIEKAALRFDNAVKGAA